MKRLLTGLISLDRHQNQNYWWWFSRSILPDDEENGMPASNPVIITQITNWIGLRLITIQPGCVVIDLDATVESIVLTNRFSSKTKTKTKRLETYILLTWENAPHKRISWTTLKRRGLEVRWWAFDLFPKQPMFVSRGLLYERLRAVR
jgi:hypothetical protein